jgi:RHS repeat-associated protein
MSFKNPIHKNAARLTVILSLVAALTNPLGAWPVRPLPNRPSRLSTPNENAPDRGLKRAKSVPHILQVDGTMNNADLQSPSLCEASCFAATYSFSTVPYYSLDQPRNLTLVYNGDQASPRPFIFADVNGDDGTGVAIDSLRMSATVNGSAVTFLTGSATVTFAAPLGPVRLTGQFDASSLSTSVYPLTITVKAFYADFTTVQKTISTQLMVLNEAGAPVARGWTIAGFQRLYSTVSPGYLVTEGDGGAVRFGALGAIAADYTTLTYDNASATYTRTYPDGSRTTFNNAGQQTSSIDIFGRAIMLGYDVNGRLQTVTDPFRKQLSGAATFIGLSYDGNGLRTIQEPGADGTPWAGRITSFLANGARCLLYAQDPGGGSTNFTCDAYGRLYTITDRRGGVTTISYDPTSWKLSQVALPQVAVDAGGGATTLTSPTYHYLPWQTAVWGTITDPVGRIRTFTVNRYGQSLDLTDPLGMHTTTTYSGIRPTTVTHPDGSTDRFRYDASGRIIMGKPAGRDSTNYVYGGALNQLSDIWGPGARTEHRSYDAQNRLFQISFDVEQTQWVQFYYDPATKRPFQVADNNMHGTNYEFDSVFGNVKKMTDAAGWIKSTTYDAFGRVATSSASGHATQSIGYDALNRITSKSDGVNPATTISYDSLFQTDLRDGNGNIYHSDHNALGWVSSQCEGSRCASARYNRDGELTSSTNSRGQMVNITRDPLGRITSKSGAGVVSATYSYSANGRILVASNGVEVDSLRRFPGNDTSAPNDTTVIWIRPDSVQAPRRYQIVHTGSRTLAGTRTTTITSNTSVTFGARQFHVNASGLLDWIYDGFNTTPIAYNTTGFRSTTTYGNSIGSRTEAYTSIYLPWSTNYSTGVVEAGFHRSYHYDGLARIDQIQSYPGTDVVQATYSYNQLGQLSQATVSTGCSLSSDNQDWGTSYNCSAIQTTDSYTYDAMGNRTDHGGVVGQWNRYQTYNGSAFAYDSSGNVTQKINPSGHNRQYFWNAENQLDSAMYDTSVRTFYEYNAEGKPVRIWDGDINSKHVQRYLVWDGDQLLAEFNPDGTRITDYIYWPGIDQPFAHTLGATAPTGVRYHQQDALMNVIGTAENGAVSQSVSYDPWGTPAITGNTTSRLLWKGLMWEGGATSLYFVRNRWYDPEAGRFMSEDPAGHAGGLNLYAFAGNDPINASDPSGTFQYDNHGAVCSIFASCGDPLEIGGQQIGGGSVDAHAALIQICKQVDCSLIASILQAITKTRYWDRASIDITAGHVTASFSLIEGNAQISLGPDIRLSAVVRVASGTSSGKTTGSIGGLLGEGLLGGGEVTLRGREIDSFSIAAGVGYQPIKFQGFARILEWISANLPSGSH